MIWTKRGSEGAELKTNNGLHLLKESTTSHDFKAKNTTGCGGIFNGTIIIGLLYNLVSEKTLSDAVKESTIIAERGLL